MKHRRKKRKPKNQDLPTIARGAMLFWEAWNLGYLNSDAEAALRSKMGRPTSFAFLFASYQVNEGIHKGLPISQSPLLESFYRVITGTAYLDYAKQSLEKIAASGGFDEAWKVLYAQTPHLHNAVEKHMAELTTYFRSGICPHNGFEDIVRQQIQHVRQVLILETKALVKSCGGKNQCPCCPPLIFQHPGRMLNRVDDWIKSFFGEREPGS